MKACHGILLSWAWIIGLVCAGDSQAQEHPVLRVWPESAPGEKKAGESGNLPDEIDSTKPTDGLVAGQRVIRLANVQTPTLTIYQPASDKKTGAAAWLSERGYLKRD